MVISVILERNPELEFQDKVDLDKVVQEAFHDFQKDHSLPKGSEKQVSKKLLTYRFYYSYWNVFINVNYVRLRIKSN